MLVHMQFKLEYFSVGFYLIITGGKNTNKHPGIFGFLSSWEHFTVTARDSNLQSNEGNLTVGD